MALPKITHPTFKILVPSLGKEYRFRPFTVKEEKILLIAQSTDNVNEIVDAVLQVINNCCVEAIDVHELASFDIDYIFIKLRSKSVNNVIKVDYRDVSGETIPIEVNLDSVTIKHFDGHEDCRNIKLDEAGMTGIVMRYPRSDIAGTLSGVEKEEQAIFKIINHCLDKVYDSENVYSFHDPSNTDQEKEEFIDALPPNVLEKVSKFFETIPRVYYESEYKKKDGTEGKIVLQSLSDFFILG